jgi:urease gamma subunit
MLHPENQTRLISLTVTDTQQQTRDFMAALAEEAPADGPEMDSWHALQQWLERAEQGVTIPYAKELATKIPSLAVRLRREFGAVLNLIKAHALLHQASRERDREGRIITTITDYRVVRELVADLVSEGIAATISPTARGSKPCPARRGPSGVSRAPPS